MAFYNPTPGNFNFASGNPTPPGQPSFPQGSFFPQNPPYPYFYPSFPYPGVQYPTPLTVPNPTSQSSSTSTFLSAQDVQKMIDEDNKRRAEAGTDFISESIISKQGPFVPEIYAAPESDIKAPNFDSFTGASDSRDARSFIYAFRERMRMRNAPDAVMCRLFSI